MISSFNSLLDKLQRINLDIRQALEQAEAAIPAINSAIEQLTRVQLLPANLLIAGEVLLERSYPSVTGPNDSGQVIQAMLVTPHGLGAVYWDLTEYVARRSAPDNPEHAREAIVKFVPFSECDSAVKALLVHQATRLIELARPSISIAHS